jgi:uncharacterized protein (DUF1697 family)
MQTFIAILRGINVNGQKIIKMDKLKDLFVHLNFKNVKTYIQSGNIVFQSENTDSQDLEKQIQQKILSDFGFEVPSMIKSKTEWQTVAKNNPFVDERAIDITKLHVTFLSKTPEQALIEKVEQGSYGTDQCIIINKTIYLFCPNGYGNTKLSNNFFENKLKVTATTRNWKTVNELLQMTEILFES